VAKRKKKFATSKKPAKKKAKKKVNDRAKKKTSAKKFSTKRNKNENRPGTAAPDKAASRVGSTTLLPPMRPRTKDRSQEKGGTAGKAVATSDRSITAIDDLRTITHVDQAAGGSCPTQTDEHSPPTHTLQIAEGVAEQEDRLEEARLRLVDANKDELLQAALWWAGRRRQPRAAIVGRALHDLQSFTEEMAYKRGTADRICRKIRHHNRLQLSPTIHAQLDSKKDQELIDSALVGALNPSWAVLEKLGLLRAAPRAGVYLIGRGPTVFDGFPEWTDVDEPWPKKPTRPPRRSRS
jgi:hypothetical protein